ncbi:hypothetical protein RJT34_25079 [Clitoria ternatea]|uniref:Fe2OG dioxygenase domain-containing protein n=1 Tax=Clitoria ternatea TaxID=43366 RepID=A0AAN9FP36_CLITE
MSMSFILISAFALTGSVVYCLVPINWATYANINCRPKQYTNINYREKNGGNVMTEISTRKRKMGDTKETAPTKPAAKWPSIKPKKNLQITPLRDFDLFTVQNFFSSAESKALIKTAEAIGFAHQGSLGPTKGEAYRDNDRISVNDPVLADTVWESGLNKLVSDIKIRGKVAVGLNPNIRLYRYKVGQRFGRHIDESVDLGDGRRTYYTLLVYLNGGPGEVKSKPKIDSSNSTGSSFEPLVGGETVFYGPRNKTVAEVAPAEGTALLHLHGDKCLLHEARNVTKGVKYVFRSDVVFA